MNIQKKFFIKIIVIIFVQLYFFSLYSSERRLYRDYTLYNQEVISSLPVSEHGAVIEKTLVARNSDDIFVCYAGYTSDNAHNSTKKTVYNKQTNIFTEINVKTKIERTLLGLQETDNENPVSTISRYKDLYLIGHENNVYACKKTIGFNMNSLHKTFHFSYLLQQDDIVDQIYIDQHYNPIVISKQGALFYHSIHCITEQSGNITPFYDLKAPCTSTTYNQQKNLLLLAADQTIHIIDLNNNESPKAYCLQVTPQINTMCNSDNFILLSDIGPTKVPQNLAETPEQQTIVFIKWDNLIQHLEDKQHLITMTTHRFSSLEKENNAIVRDVFLTKDDLLIFSQGSSLHQCDLASLFSGHYLPEMLPYPFYQNGMYAWIKYNYDLLYIFSAIYDGPTKLPIQKYITNIARFTTTPVSNQKIPTYFLMVGLKRMFFKHPKKIMSLCACIALFSIKALCKYM